MVIPEPRSRCGSIARPYDSGRVSQIPNSNQHHGTVEGQLLLCLTESVLPVEKHPRMPESWCELEAIAS